jgi:hypothetical protein
MRRILICTGVLGGGTAIVFALAALTAALFPQGSVVAAGWNGGWNGGWEKGIAMPVPMPAPVMGFGGAAPDVTGDQVAIPADIESPQP